MTGRSRHRPGQSAGISALIAIALTVSFASRASAADVAGAIGPYDLEEIVVTASRRAEIAFEMPYTVNTQDMHQLQEHRQVRTLPDAMREMPAVMVQKTGHGQGSPYIRGFTGLRTLFLIDGIRLNNSTFREGPNQYWNTVDPFSVSRLELVKGPSSVLYGSDAVGGTVNAISRSADDTATGTHGRLVVRGASAEQSLVVRPELDYSGNGLTLFGGFSLKNFGNLVAGGATGEQPKTGYDEYAADMKVTADLSGGRQLVAALQHVNQDDAWRVHKTVFGKSWRGTTTGSELERSLDQRRTLAYLQYRAEEVTSSGGDLTLSLSYHEQEESRLRIRSDGRKDVQGTDVGTLGFWGQFSIPAASGTWTVGTEIYRDSVDSHRSDFDADGSLRGVRIQGPVADDASYLTAGLFVQNQFMLGEKTSLIAGLRYTHSSADADAVQDPVSGERTAIEDSWSDLTASVRLSRPLGSSGGTRLFAGVSQGFRAPNLSDLTRFDSARSNEIETPVTGLDAEKFITYEVGLKIVRADLDAQLAAYYTDIDDLVIRTPTGRIIDGDNEITKRNSARGYVKGLEMQARYQLTGSWSLFGNITWLDGVVDTYPTSEAALVREPIDRLMPVTVWLGTEWRPPAADYWVEALLSVSDKQDRLSTRDRNDTDRIPTGGTPGHTTVTLRGGWRVSESLFLSASLENIFDEDYRIHGSGLNEPGRNLVVSIFWSPQQE